MVSTEISSYTHIGLLHRLTSVIVDRLVGEGFDEIKVRKDDTGTHDGFIISVIREESPVGAIPVSLELFSIHPQLCSGDKLHVRLGRTLHTVRVVRAEGIGQSPTDPAHRWVIELTELVRILKIVDKRINRERSNES